LPEIILVGDAVLVNPTGMVLVWDKPSPVTGTPEKPLDVFTTMIHGKSGIHRIQTFLRMLYSLLPFTSPLAKLLVYTGWLDWKCEDCSQWVSMVKKMQRDPYGVQTDLTLEEWVLLVQGHDNAGAHVIHSGSIMSKAALIFQEEFLKICSHTTIPTTRRQMISHLGSLVAPISSVGSESDIVVLARDIIPRWKDWLIQHVKFIPFSQIDFERMLHGLLMFRCGLPQSHTPPSSPQENRKKELFSLFFQKFPFKHPRFMMDVVSIFVEKRDTAFGFSLRNARGKPTDVSFF
jgi:hypothetical protein